MDDFTERKIPKRKDRMNLMVLFYVALFAVPIIGVFYPVIGEFLFEESIWVFILLIFALFAGISYAQWQQWHKRWQNIAESSGLIYEKYKPNTFSFFNWPRIRGVRQGFGIKIERFTRGSGKYKKVYTSINVTLKRGVTEELSISKTSLLSGVKRAFFGNNRDMKYVQVGDEDFEKKLEIKSVSEQFARNILSSYSVKQALLEIRSQAPDMHLSVGSNSLYYHERTNITDSDYMQAVFKTMVELAEYVDRYAN